MSSDNDGSIDAVRDGRCPKCAGRLFEIIPHQTTWHAIEEFLEAAEFEGVDLALAERWIHPGSYCHQHGCLVLAEFGLPEGTDWGAARYFGSWEFRGERKKELKLLPVELKKQLLKHVLEHSDRENANDARGAFGDGPV